MPCHAFRSVVYAVPKGQVKVSHIRSGLRPGRPAGLTSSRSAARSDNRSEALTLDDDGRWRDVFGFRSEVVADERLELAALGAFG
jgi:hypothetical protein